MAAGRRSPPGPCCPPRVAVPSVHQSLSEMDFERGARLGAGGAEGSGPRSAFPCSELPPPAGIWAAARDGDEARVLQLLERRGEPSQPDLAGYTALVRGMRGSGRAAGGREPP